MKRTTIVGKKFLIKIKEGRTSPSRPDVIRPIRYIGKSTYEIEIQPFEGEGGLFGGTSERSFTSTRHEIRRYYVEV